jgi:hypothetical protein
MSMKSSGMKANGQGGVRGAGMPAGGGRRSPFPPSPIMTKAGKKSNASKRGSVAGAHQTMPGSGVQC